MAIKTTLLVWEAHYYQIELRIFIYANGDGNGNGNGNADADADARKTGEIAYFRRVK